MGYRTGDYDNDNTLLLRSDYDDLIADIRGMKLSQTYSGLMSWLLDRCFQATPPMKRNEHRIRSQLKKNRSLLMSVLYDINPDAFLSCFAKKCQKTAFFCTT